MKQNNYCKSFLEKIKSLQIHNDPKLVELNKLIKNIFCC